VPAEGLPPVPPKPGRPGLNMIEPFKSAVVQAIFTQQSRDIQSFIAGWWWF